MKQTLTRVLTEEAEAILALRDRLTENFEQAAQAILEAKGRLITCGIGKSGHIAAKAAATFASTGTPSFFLHAAEAVHGDLGMVTPDDVLLLYTFSGETDELVRLYPHFQSIGARLIVMTGRKDSTAARESEFVLDVSVAKEACSINLAPTTSTTLMLALSDALAVAVMEARGFGPDDFARFHPAGTLGKRLLLTVEMVMRKGDDLPVVPPTAEVLDVMKVISQIGAGGACVVDAGLVGYISDGDLRRWFLSSEQPLNGTALDVMSRGPATVSPDLLAADAVEIFQNYPRQIGELPVVKDGELVGLLLLKDLLRAGIL